MEEEREQAFVLVLMNFNTPTLVMMCANHKHEALGA